LLAKYQTLHPTWFKQNPVCVVANFLDVSQHPPKPTVRSSNFIVLSPSASDADIQTASSFLRLN